MFKNNSYRVCDSHDDLSMCLDLIEQLDIFQACCDCCALGLKAYSLSLNCDMTILGKLFEDFLSSFLFQLAFLSQAINAIVRIRVAVSMEE